MRQKVNVKHCLIRAAGFAMLLFNVHSLKAQCTSPTSIGTPTITDASCPGGGKVTVSSMVPTSTSIAPDYYQYALYDTMGNVVLPWQSSNELSNVYSGTYDIWARKVCNTGFSNPVLKRVVVNNTEVMSNITSITVNHLDHGCNNGRFTVSATGSAPLEYALVPSITSVEPVTNYIRPRQSSNIFDSLPAGTYNVRVYNSCNNAVTQSVTVPAFNTGLVQVNNPIFSPYACDSFSFSFSITNHVQVNNTKDTQMVRAWVNWPNGTTDTFKLGAGAIGGATATASFFNAIAKLDPGYNPALSFWQNLSNFPYSISYGYRDVCGNIYTNSFVLQQPQQKNLIITTTETNSLTNCNNIAAYFNIRYTRTAPSQTLNYQFRNMHNVMYSLDSGATWTNARTPNTLSTSSDYFRVPRGTAQMLMVAYCGDTITNVINPPAFPTLSSSVAEYSYYSCIGHTGISLSRGNALGDTLGIEMLAAPSGQAVVPYFKSPSSASTFPLSNLLPGAYTLRIWDTFGVACPRFVDRTVTISRPFALDFSTAYNCNNTMSVISTNTYASGASNIALGNLFRVKVFNNSGTLVLGGANGYAGSSVGTTTTVSIPASAIASLPDGNYTIRTYKYINTAYANILDTCAVVEKVWEKQSNALSLAPSKFIPGCPGNTGSIVGIARGGKAPYHFKLFDPSNNEVLADASGSNIFDNLNVNSTYTLQVIDTCGTVVNRTLSIGQDLAIHVLNTATMPCPGDNVTLFLDSMPNVQYQWYKNDILMAGQTQHRLQLNNISASDSGAYKVQVDIGDCLVMVNSFVLDPADCGSPLPVQLADFIAYNMNGKGQLEWSTYSESDNREFVIERSTDAKIWAKRGSIPSKAEHGNSTELLSYEFEDNLIDADAYYYRLKQVNNDGRYAYSSVRKVAFTKVTEVSVYPNPVKDNVVTINGINGCESVNIYNMTGQLISSHKVNGASIVLDVKHLPSGIYQLELIYKGGPIVNKRLVKHSSQ